MFYLDTQQLLSMAANRRITALDLLTFFNCIWQPGWYSFGIQLGIALDMHLEPEYCKAVSVFLVSLVGLLSGFSDPAVIALAVLEAGRPTFGGDADFIRKVFGITTALTVVEEDERGAYEHDVCFDLDEDPDDNVKYDSDDNELRCNVIADQMSEVWSALNDMVDDMERDHGAETPQQSMTNFGQQSDEEMDVSGSMSLLELSPGKRMRKKGNGAEVEYVMSPGKRMREKGSAVLVRKRSTKLCQDPDCVYTQRVSLQEGNIVYLVR